MKNSLIIFFIALSSTAFATASANKDGADADPGKPAEANPHFTLPIGFPVSLSAHDSAVVNSKKDSSRNVIKGQTLARKKIYQVSIENDNSVSGWRQTEEAFRQAQDMNADYILIHVDDDNAYTTANKIRNQLYHYKTPVLLYVDNKNKTNKSIIPLNADTLSQLRSQANAKSHFPNGTYESTKLKKENGTEEKRPYIVSLGKKCEWNENLPSGKGVNFENSGQTVTKTLSEAGINNVDIINYRPTPIGKLIDNLSATSFSLFLILLILGGIYFELRSIAKGLSMFISVCASLLLFASHYFEGDQEIWYALIFVTGLVLLGRNIYYSTRGLYSALLGVLFIFSAFVLCLSGSEGILLSTLLVTATVSFTLFVCTRVERRLLNLKFISEKIVHDVSANANFASGTLSPTS